MSSLNFVKDSSGTFIPSSQRPDGTWRKPIRVKDGYVPQEEQPLYVSKGKQYKEYRANVPIGMTESDVSSYRASGSSSKGNSALYDVGIFTIPKVAAPIPGLNFVETSEPEKPASKSSKKKSKSKSKSAAGPESDAKANGTAAKTGGAPAPGSNQAAGAVATDPAKRLRNLRKRLKDIESLENKIASGELKNPEKEQLEKIGRKEEVIDEIEELEHLVDSMNLS